MGYLHDIARSRILNQYSQCPNMLSIYRAVWYRYEDTYDALMDLFTGYHIDTAIGHQLDVIGKLLDMPRFNVPWPDDNIFTFRETEIAVSDPDLSFGDGLGNGGYFQYHVGGVTDAKVDDETYRPWIKAKALGSHSGASVNDIYDFIFEATGVTSTIAVVPPQSVIITLGSPLTTADRHRILTNAPIAAGKSLSFSD